jgi:hypothetical protein
VRLTNTGEPCRLRGYPALVFADAGSHRIDFRVTHRPDRMVGGKPSSGLSLPTGSEAWFAMDKFRCDRGDREHVHLTSIRPSGATGGVTIDGPRQWAYCGPGDPGSAVVVSPFEPTLGATLRAG